MHLDPHARERDEPLEQVAQAHAAPGAHVVDLTGRTVFCEQRVRAHDVAHIAEIAHGVTVAERDLVAAFAFGRRDAGREPGNEERG